MLKSNITRIAVVVLAVGLFLFSAFALCNTNTFYQDRLAEQQTITALSQWVTTSTKETVPVSEAAAIVKAVYQYSKEHNVDPLLLLSMMRHESGFQKKAKSRGGAKGLMQVIPYWHRDKIKGRNIFDTAVNIDVGTQVIDQCLVKYNDNVKQALRCYSGGANSKYYLRIANTHKQMRSHLVEYAILNERPVADTLAFGKPRIFTEDPINILVAQKKPNKASDT